MTEKELRERIASAVGDVDLSDTDIPSIDLYLDQILSLVSEKNAVSTPRYHDRLLTKTMVNNYSKNELISPIEGKKYSRAHIVEMLLIYALKNTLSIEEIKRVLVGVREEGGFAGEDLIRAYREFLTLKKNNRTRVADIVENVLQQDGLNTDSDYGFFLSLLDVLSLSAYLKEVGREMLEHRYKDLALREQEMREREEQEKQEKGAVKQERKEAKGAVKQERKEAKGAEKREKKVKKVQEKADRKIAKLESES